MKIGILLLNKNDMYLTKDGRLPTAPKWDKTFLKDLIKGKRVLCSFNTLKDLPKSILDCAYFTTNENLDYDVNFGISTFKNKVDLLFIVRSEDTFNDGKKFNLSDYSLKLKKGDLEIWTKD